MINPKIDGLIVLLADVETSDQLGLSTTVTVGAFDDMIEMGRAMGATDAFYSRQRVNFRQVEVGAVNRMATLAAVRR